MGRATYRHRARTERNLRDLKRPAVRVFLASVLVVLVWPAVAQARILAFKSPTGNITCVISTDADQPQFAQCELRSKAKGFFVSRRGHVRSYGVDPFDDLSGRRFVLRYGRSVRLGPFVCISRATGMTCRSRLSGHGFTISRERQRVF